MSEPEAHSRTRSRTSIKAAPATAGEASGPYSPAVDLDSRQPSEPVVVGPERFRRHLSRRTMSRRGSGPDQDQAKNSLKSPSTLDDPASRPAISGSESQLGIVAR